MATIVEHTETGGVYVLLGTGFGAYKAMKPNWFFGNWMADEQSDQLAMVCVCDYRGQIGWFRSQDLRVISVDGQMPESLLVSAPEP